MRKLLTTALATLLMAGCTTDTVYSTYQHTPVKGWEKNDTLAFDIPPLPADGSYALDLGLRINKAYPFMSLTFIVEQTAYPGKRQRRDTLNCPLINENGNMLGQGVSNFQYNFHAGTIQLSTGDSLHITVRHDMKREIMPGITDIGLTLKKERPEAKR